MRIVALIISDLIRRWVWFFFPVMAIFLAGLFYGWGVNWATVLAAIAIVMVMSLAGFLAWFWLQVFKGLGAGPEAGEAGSGPEVQNMAGHDRP